MARGPIPHDLVPLIDPLEPSGRQRPRRVLVEEVLTADHQQKGFELLTCVGVEADPAISRRLDRRDLCLAGKSCYRRATSECVIQVDEPAGAQVTGLHQGTVDEFPTTAVLYAPEGSECPHGSIAAQYP